MANPIFIPAVFAETGVKNPIQKTLQPNQQPQEATWEKGWGNVTFIPIDSGGKAPLGQDFNGVLNAITSNVVHTQNGKRYKWSQEVVDNYGGYSFGDIVQSDDGLKEFRSILDNNTYNPNINPTNSWIVYSGVGSIPVATSTVAGVTKVLNTLNSTDVASALSAAQGKALDDSKVAKTDIVNTLTSTETEKPLSAAQGNILNNQALGIGQTWQTPSRAKDTTYTNTTSKPIFVMLGVQDISIDTPLTIVVNGVTILNVSDFGAHGTHPVSFIVPPSATYRVNANQNTIRSWAELR